MVYLKSCPKCLGDLTVSQDVYGTFISCLQCGLTRDIDVHGAQKPAAPTPAAVPSWAREEEVLPRAA